MLLGLILLPMILGALTLLMPSPKKSLGLMLTGVLLTSLMGIYSALTYFRAPASFPQSGWLFLDALSAFHLLIMMAVFIISACFAWIYFTRDTRHAPLSLHQARLFSCLFTQAQAAMLLTLLANNLGLMWVGIETTTLATAFLIHLHPSRESLEAMWKYILICSVGVAFAFLGTLLTAAAAQGLPIASHEILHWTVLKAHANLLNPALLKTAFIFILVGYGTKAGLAPLHNWLPDAHSQAPAPVSALFSGFMLNAALYCIMRFIPILNLTLGSPDWSSGLLKGFGLLSVLVAAAFIIFQTDIKRLLAFCSIEHMGIILLGIGLGGAGVFAALFHALNHSLAKTLSFCSAGRLGQIFGTHDMRKMDGTFRIQPIWAMGLFASLLALIGVVPFALFISEFLLIKSAVASGQYYSLVLFLLGAGVILTGMLGRAIRLFWGTPDQNIPAQSAGKLEKFLVIAPLLALLTLGLCMPPFLKEMLTQSTAILTQGGAQ